MYLILLYKHQKQKNAIQLLHKHNFYNYNINYIKHLKKVVYTALLGEYDNINTIKKEDGYDYFIFTDQILKNNSNNWTILNINEMKHLNINIIKRQRFFKTHPHLFFKNYDLSIYVDTSIVIKGKLDEFILRILTPKLSIYILEHPRRNTINNEFQAVIDLKKDTKMNVNKVRQKYNKLKFPDNNGLAECCLIIRKHNNLNCINFMNKWFEEIVNNSHRDQLSFNFILWKNGNKEVKYISKEVFYQYFKYMGHKKKLNLSEIENYNVKIVYKLEKKK